MRNPLVAAFAHRDLPLLDHKEEDKPEPALKKEESFNVLSHSGMGRSSYRSSSLMASSMFGAPNLPSMHLSEP